LYSSLVSTYGLDGSGNRQPEVLIMLEQETYINYVGYVTKAAAVRHLANLIYQKHNDVQVNCGVTAGRLGIGINAYPYFPDLNYRLLCSYGTLSDPTILEVEKKETVQLHLETEVNVRYPVLAILSAEWLNSAYDANMEMIPQPAILIGDDVKSVRSAIPCYGSVEVTYTTVVHCYALDIVARERLEDKYSSVVYAVYDGGLVWLETTSPTGADDTDGDCAWGSTVNSIPTDQRPKKPNPEYADKWRLINYCTQKKISESIQES
jgi:hypothetical protein